MYTEKQVWDPLTRVWHILLILTVVGGWLIGEFRTFGIMQWHFYCGYATGGLVLFRIIRGFSGPTEIRFSSLLHSPHNILRYAATLTNKQPSGTPGHNPLGSLFILLIVAALAGQVVTGLFSKDDALFFSGPLASFVSESTVLSVTSLHNLNSTVILVLVGVHVTAILFYWVWKKENLIKPMITGKKK